MKGIVKFFDMQGGFGFIIDENGREYYFPMLSTLGHFLPEAGDRVEFIPHTNKKGLFAYDVREISKT